MTVQEAIERLVQKLCCEKEPHKFCSDACMYGEEHCEFQVAKMCMEKQIPKKPTIEQNSYDDDCYECPCCESFIGYVSDCKDDENYQANYCLHCGQRISWTEEGES